jgi:uncharacterized protein YcnI
MLNVPARLVLRLAPLAVLLTVVTTVVCSGATWAGADVAIQPPAVAPGDLVAFTVQVLNDRAPAATTRVELDFPKQPAVAYLDAVPVAGWSMRVVKYRLAHAIDTPDGTSGVAISRVIWTGGPLGGASLVRFTLRIGPVPASSSRFLFTARQTYDTGATVTYDDNPDQATAARPKPVLAVSRYATTRAPGAAVAPDAPFNLTEKQAIDRRVRTLIRNGEIATPDDLESARWVALAALVVASIGLGFAYAAWARTRRRAPGSSPPTTGASDNLPDAEAEVAPSSSGS